MHPDREKMKRIGLYGGSFDPVHLGHLLVAMAALEEVPLDRVFFIPAAQSPFKPDRLLAPAHERLRLLRLALAGQTQMEVDAQELERGGISYTISTVRAYREKYPACELFYLIGEDHVSQLEKWRDASELQKQIEFLIIPRPGQIIPSVPKGFRMRPIAGFPLGVSSSQIRERVKRGLSIDYLTAPAVGEAIRNNGLYL